MTAFLRSASILCLLGACAPLAETPPAPANAALDPVAQVALDLAAAEELYHRGNMPALAQLVQRLRQQGVHPIDEADASHLETWEAAAGIPQAPPFRGRALGPGYNRGTLSPGQNAVLSQIFLSGQKTAISLGERPPAKISLRLYDSKDALVCEHAPARGKVCRFTPVFTQRYRIEIRNGGKRDAVYYLAMD